MPYKHSDIPGLTFTYLGIDYTFESYGDHSGKIWMQSSLGERTLVTVNDELLNKLNTGYWEVKQ
jgi:hypothetical protein